MTSTKIITPTNLGITALAVLLFGFAAVNLWADFRPTAAANDRIAHQINQSSALGFAPRLTLLSDLREKQEALLARNPIDSYAWIRLAYLRQQTMGNRPFAFEALRFADMISYPDNLGGIERILMWRDYADMQSDAERSHEKDMWRLGYRLNWYDLETVATQRGLRDVLVDAIKDDPVLHQRWQTRHKH
ncbi:MAG: hypothetical protein EB059_01445 [Alphaproteobacteria bacterium]|nr:hypothetical protein [Alphaproteobacteria bacterium]